MLVLCCVGVYCLFCSIVHPSPADDKVLCRYDAYCLHDVENPFSSYLGGNGHQKMMVLFESCSIPVLERRYCSRDAGILCLCSHFFGTHRIVKCFYMYLLKDFV